MRVVRPAIGAVLVYFLAWAGGCAPGDVSSEATVADSAGVRIVTYDLAGVVVPTYRGVGDADLEIGALDGTPEYTFSRIADLAVFPDGSVAVSDAVARELRVYDADGTFLRTLGAGGDGPWEFATAPTIAGVARDTVFAFDARNRRVTSFTTGGQQIEMLTFQEPSAGRPRALIRLADGSYLSRSDWVERSGQPPTSHDMRLEVDSIVVERLDAVGGLLDTLHVMADRTRVRRVEVQSGGLVRVQQANPPHMPQGIVDSDGAGLVTATSDSFEIEVRGAAGDLLTILRASGVRHPATATDIRARQEAALREDMGEEIDPLVLRLNLDFLPDRLPAFAELLVGRSGDIWIARYQLDQAEGTDWLVFTAAGELLGTVHTPPGFRVFHIGEDSLVGVFLDELEVPYVRRYELLPAEGGGA